MKHYTKQLGIRLIALALVIGALLIGGVNITRAAALVAIPGDALYPVKTAIEQTRLTLAQDAGDRAQMKISFADQRLEEIAALIESGRYHLVGEAVLAFEKDINGAILELETIAGIDPAQASRIALEITAALTRYAQTLSVMASNAPDSVRQEVTRALDTAQIAAGLELPESGQSLDGNVNGDDSANSNGDDDNANGNGDDDNANGNGDDDANSNSDDDNANSNDDDANSNGDDDNANINGDDGDDDDANSNGDDDNPNHNGDDDDDDNANSNGGDDNANSSGSNDNDDDHGGNSGSGGGDGDNSNDD